MGLLWCVLAVWHPSSHSGAVGAKTCSHPQSGGAAIFPHLHGMEEPVLVSAAGEIAVIIPSTPGGLNGPLTAFLGSRPRAKTELWGGSADLQLSHNLPLLSEPSLVLWSCTSFTDLSPHCGSARWESFLPPSTSLWGDWGGHWPVGMSPGGGSWAALFQGARYARK